MSRSTATIHGQVEKNEMSDMPEIPERSLRKTPVLAFLRTTRHTRTPHRRYAIDFPSISREITNAYISGTNDFSPTRTRLIRPFSLGGSTRREQTAHRKSTARVEMRRSI